MLQMNYQSNLQSNSQPFFFIKFWNMPLIRPQSGVLLNLSSSMQPNSSLKVQGRPLNNSPLLLVLRFNVSQMASLIFFEHKLIQGNSPFSKNMSEQTKLQSQSFLPMLVFEFAALLLNLNEPLNLSLRSQVICLPFFIQRELSQKSDKQILCFIFPLPTRKLLGLISPCKISLLCKYSILQRICKPIISTVLSPNLPPQRTLKVSTLSASSSITRQALQCSQNASFISGKPCRCGCVNF